MSRMGFPDAISLAERLFVLLNEGAYTATYKLAVLAALMDLTLEHTTHDGSAPDTFTTAQLAEKVIQLYWPQTTAYATREQARVLRQSTGRQAAIVNAILNFRDQLTGDPNCSLPRARTLEPHAWTHVLREVEWILIKMPLPKLQRIGGSIDEFLYRIHWDDDVNEKCVRDYQRNRRSEFDNRIVLLPGVASALVRLHGLLRPILHRKWTQMVARINRLEEATLESFLFGAERISLQPVRASLFELHSGRCFYCEGQVHLDTLEIDHFIPWSRHPDNAVANLVPAHRSCNANKSDLLAARGHVVNWRTRMLKHRADLATIANTSGFEHAADRTLNVARGIYMLMPTTGRLWLRTNEFERVGMEPIAPLFDPVMNV